MHNSALLSVMVAVLVTGCNSHNLVERGAVGSASFADLEPADAAVSGTAVLEGWPKKRHNLPVTVEIRRGNRSLQTVTVPMRPTARGGEYVVPLLVPMDFDEYEVTVKVGHWLRGFGKGISLPGGRFDVTLRSGDVTGDGVVDVSDVASVLQEMDGEGSDSDLTGDRRTDVSDLRLVLANYGAREVAPADNAVIAPTLDGLAGNARNLLLFDLGVSNNPYAPYRIYRRHGASEYKLVGETFHRVWVDSSGVSNGVAHTYVVCAADSNGADGPTSKPITLTPSADHPTCVAEISSESSKPLASGILSAKVGGMSRGIEGISLCIDGEYVNYTVEHHPNLSYDSEEGRNGLRAVLVVVWDSKKRYGFSDVTSLTFVNEISHCNMQSPDGSPMREINPDKGERMVFTARLRGRYRYRVEVLDDATGQVIRSWEAPYPSSVVWYEWDGKDDAGNPVEDATYAFVVTVLDKPERTRGTGTERRRRPSPGRQRAGGPFGGRSIL